MYKFKTSSLKRFLKFAYYKMFKSSHGDNSQPKLLRHSFKPASFSAISLSPSLQPCNTMIYSQSEDKVKQNVSTLLENQLQMTETLIHINDVTSRLRARINADLINVKASRNNFYKTINNNNILMRVDILKQPNKALACSLLSQLEDLQSSVKRVVNDE